MKKLYQRLFVEIDEAGGTIGEDNWRLLYIYLTPIRQIHDERTEGLPAQVLTQTCFEFFFGHGFLPIASWILDK